MCVQDTLSIPCCKLRARSLGLLGARRRGYRTEPATRRIGRGVVYSPGARDLVHFSQDAPNSAGTGCGSS